MKKLFVLALGILALGGVVAHASEKIPVRVECEVRDGDYVGSQLCADIKSQIFTSEDYRLINRNEKSNWVLSFASNGDETSSSGSAVLLLQSDDVCYYIMHWALYTPANKVNDQSVWLMSAIESQVNELVREIARDINSKHKKYNF